MASDILITHRMSREGEAVILVKLRRKLLKLSWRWYSTPRDTSLLLQHDLSVYRVHAEN